MNPAQSATKRTSPAQSHASTVAAAPRDATAPGIRSASVIGGLASASGIALTATAGWLIVAASHQPVILTLLAVIVAVRTFGIARPVLRYAERVRSHDAALDLLARRRVTAYQALIPLTPARLGRRARSHVLTGAVDDLDDLVFAHVRVTVPVLGSALAGVLTVLALGYLVPAGGLLVFAVLVGHAATSVLAGRLELSAQRQWLAARAEAARTATLVAGYAGPLRGVGAGEAALTWMRAAHAELARATTRLARVRALSVSLGYLVTGVGTAGAALVAWWAMGYGVSDAVAAIVILTPLAVGDAFVGLPDAMGAWARAKGSRRRLDELLQQTPAVTDPAVEPGVCGQDAATERPGGAVPTIELDRVSARWWPADSLHGKPEPDLPPVSLLVPPGEHLALTGANGSGKSTLLAVIARHLDPASGRYLLGGSDVTRLGLDAARAHIALVDDEPHVFSSSLRENLRLARPDADDAAVVGALRAAGLADWLAGLSDGLDTMLGTDGRGVSGGERARIGLARAHLSDRPIVLLDEPVAHLDHATAMAVLADVHSCLRGRTVVMVSHRPDGLEHFHRTVDLAELLVMPTGR